MEDGVEVVLNHLEPYKVNLEGESLRLPPSNSRSEISSLPASPSQGGA